VTMAAPAFLVASCTASMGASMGGRSPMLARTNVMMAAALPPIGSPVSELILQHRAALDELLARTVDVRAADEAGGCDDVWALRFVLEGPDDVDGAEVAMRSVLEWRAGAGRPIVRAAAAAITAATAGGGWDNDEVVSRAPHADKLRPYVGASQIQTIPSADGSYLIYTIRASAIDDKALMQQVTSDELCDFFIYTKEVNAAVANARTRQTGRLVCVVTANDLTGINLFGAADFRTALSAASKATASLYPSTAGPTILLNLPPLLGALVKLFTPLFPKAVLERLRFETGPLKGVDDLSLLLRSASGPEREQFLADIHATLALGQS